MNIRFRKLLHAGVMAMVATSLTVLGTSARTSHSASHASLPTLRFDEYISSHLALAATLDPAYVTSYADEFIVQLTHVGLVQSLPTGKVAKQLASSIKVSGGGKVYTFQMHHWT